MPAAVQTEAQKNAQSLLSRISLFISQKEELKNFKIKAIKKIQVAEDRAAIVIFVPYRAYFTLNSVRSLVVQEVEKKHANTTVIIIPQRSIVSDKLSRYTNQIRAHSRTLSAVYDAILNDVVAPSIVVGKRIRYKSDGSSIIKVFLDKNTRKDVEAKIATFTAVYFALTHRNVEFSFQ